MGLADINKLDLFKLTKLVEISENILKRRVMRNRLPETLYWEMSGVKPNPKLRSFSN